MRPSLTQLETFYWVANLGGFRAAARHLNVTQPTLSQRVRELERTLGTQLFDRTGRAPRLTARGAIILRYVEQMLTLSDEVRRHGRSPVPMQALLRIGAADVFAMLGLPELVGVLESRYPDLTVEVSVAFSHSLNRMLTEGHLDIAFLTIPDLPATVRAEPLGNVELGWMAAPALDFPDRTLRPADLVHHPVVTNPSPSHLYQSVLEWFGNAGEAPRRISTCNNLSIIARLAVSGFGVTLLPLSLRVLEPEAGMLRLLPTAPAVPPHPMYAAYPQRKAGPEVDAVLGEARAIIARRRLLGAV